MAGQVRERDIEARLRDGVKKLGGIAYKFVSPGNAGVPDRLVLLPGGKVAFVELKAPGGKSTALQTAQQKRIAGLGFLVKVVSDYQQVDDLLGGFTKGEMQE